MGSPKGLGRDGGVYGLGFRVWVYGLGFPIMEIMPGDHEPNHPKHLARNPKLTSRSVLKGLQSYSARGTKFRAGLRFSEFSDSFQGSKGSLRPSGFPYKCRLQGSCKGVAAERDPQGVPVSGKVLSTLEGQLLNQKRLV